MIQIVAFLIENFNNIQDCGDHDLESLLEDMGFAFEDIGTTLWVLRFLKTQTDVSSVDFINNRKMRVYAWEETQYLPTEVRGLLHLLSETKAINAEQREFIVHTLMLVPLDEITLDHAKALTLLILWVNGSELPALIGDELMAVLRNRQPIH